MGRADSSSFRMTTVSAGGLSPRRTQRTQARMMDRIYGADGVDLRASAWDGIRVGLVGPLCPWGPMWRFGLSFNGGNRVTIHPGTIRIAQIGDYETYETDTTLSASTEWISATLPWDKSCGATVGPVSTEPTSDAVYMRFPLYKFKAISPGNYRLVGFYHAGSDICVASPLR